MSDKPRTQQPDRKIDEGKSKKPEELGYNPPPAFVVQRPKPTPPPPPKKETK